MHNYTHIQNLLTTNWQIVRLKLPVPEQNIGWRVEFRTMEVHCVKVPRYHGGREKGEVPGLYIKIAYVACNRILIFNTLTLFQLQLTSSENAAFTVFVMLLARMIISLRPKFYIPVTKVETVYQTTVEPSILNSMNCKPRDYLDKCAWSQMLAYTNLHNHFLIHEHLDIP